MLKDHDVWAMLVANATATRKLECRLMEYTKMYKDYIKKNEEREEMIQLGELASLFREVVVQETMFQAKGIRDITSSKNEREYGMFLKNINFFVALEDARKTPDDPKSQLVLEQHKLDPHEETTLLDHIDIADAILVPLTGVRVLDAARATYVRNKGVHGYVELARDDETRELFVTKCEAYNWSPANRDKAKMMAVAVKSHLERRRDFDKEARAKVKTKVVKNKIAPV